MNVVELFAGPGGMSEGIRQARPGAKVVGIEWDQWACATARAAGHHRVQADIALLDPLGYHEADYLHASPSCQGFSMAGKGAGRRDGERLLTAIRLAAEHRDRVEEIMATFDASANDHRSVLTLEPLRWTAAIEPTYVTLEQVPTVLPLWEAYAATLTAWGYSAWAGNLQSECFGTPQTRKRAFLIARKDGQAATPPTPTHSKYHSRSPERLDPGVLPWVSMAEALGWGMNGRPSMTVTGGGTATGGAEPFGNGSRKGMAREREAGRWSLRNNTSANAAVRDEDQPAPTMYFGQRVNGVKWQERINNQSGTEFDEDWPSKRPATTVAGREIVTNPGANANRFNGATKSRNDGIQVTVEEAGVLQGFPAAYPWQGNKGQRYQQCGNAVPVQLARAVADHLLPKEER